MTLFLFDLTHINLYSPHTQTDYFHLLKGEEANNSALALTAETHTKAFAHTKVLGLFWHAASLLFCFMGLGGGAGCFAALPVIRRLCLELVRKEAPVRSIHPLRRFPAECDVGVGK